MEAFVLFPKKSAKNFPWKIPIGFYYAREGELFWYLANTVSKMSSTIPFDHAFVYNENLADYHFSFFESTSIFRKVALPINPLEKEFVPLFLFIKATTPLQLCLDYASDCEVTKVIIGNKALSTLYLKKPLMRTLLDNKVVIDNCNWAVTLIDSGQSDPADPMTWGGHAAIIIEGVGEKGHFIKKGHLRIAKGRPKVSFELLSPQFYQQRHQFVEKTETYRRSRQKVEDLMKAMEWESQHGELSYHRQGDVDCQVVQEGFKELEDAENLRKKLDPDGLGQHQVKQHSNGTFGVFKIPDNCITWALKKLKIADINPESKWPKWISKFIVLPIAYIKKGEE